MECQRGSSLPAGRSWTGQQGGGRHFTLRHPRKMIELVVNSRGALAKCKAISERCVTLSAKQGTRKCRRCVMSVGLVTTPKITINSSKRQQRREGVESAVGVVLSKLEASWSGAGG